MHTFKRRIVLLRFHKHFNVGKYILLFIEKKNHYFAILVNTVYLNNNCHNIITIRPVKRFRNRNRSNNSNF